METHGLIVTGRPGTVVPVRNWSFALRPKWLLSHLFTGSIVVVFVIAGFWQLSRLDQRRAQNQAIIDRSTQEPVLIEEALAGSSGTGYQMLDYVAVRDTGAFLDGEVVRVANRSQNGLGGDWVVGLFETDAGTLVLVNRGFADRDQVAIDPPAGPITLDGWLRLSQTKDGFFGATDTGVGERAPRLDVAAIGERLGIDVAPMWVAQAGPPSAVAPDPVPLPPISEGSHFSYALQWFTFALMGLGVYCLVLWRRAGVRPDND